MPARTLPALDLALVVSPGFAEATAAQVPDAALLALPERVVQFGTGAFLRGFVDCFIDAANRAGHFDGRIVAVGSTGSGRDGAINDQDGLYTLCVQGVVDGRPHEETRIIASVSRAISAADAWSEVLACARNPDIELVFSNTTEVGIALDEGDEPSLEPPRSFPGKLTRFLYERARAFEYDPSNGLVVIPCELIENNGDRLRSIVLELARRWTLGEAFTSWLERAVPFCNTLVDRIVPGTPPAERMAELRESLGYDDALVTACESYRLFAIEGDEALCERLRFAAADPGIIVAPDIAPYRERKVRLLNGTHTIAVPVALLAGCETVREAVEHPMVGRFISRVMLEEIATVVQAPGVPRYARDVLDRFANPFIHHALFDITLQATMKMRVRIVPTLVRLAESTGRVPANLTFGFAAMLAFARGDLQDARRSAGLAVPADDQGDALRALWNGVDARDEVALRALVERAAADATLWGSDLTALPGFADAVAAQLHRIVVAGMPAALEMHLASAAA
jgi:tagaturonate reductase